MVRKPNTSDNATPAAAAAMNPTVSLPLAQRGGETGHRTDQHHAFNAEIEDAGSFDNGFAERCVDQRRGRDHGAGDHGDKGIHAAFSTGAAGFAAGLSVTPTRFSRNVMNRSAASR